MVYYKNNYIDFFKLQNFKKIWVMDFLKDPYWPYFQKS
jgi:hypothetical protein